MPPSLLHLPDELLLRILSFIYTENFAEEARYKNVDRPYLNGLALCSRRLHAIVTPVLYASIAVGDSFGDDLPLLLRSLVRHPHLRQYTRSVSLTIAEAAHLYGSQRDKYYFEDDADAKLLGDVVNEVLDDDVWDQPPPEGWCSGQLHQREGYGPSYSPWLNAINGIDQQGAQFALLLALLPGVTHLDIQTSTPSLRFGRWLMDDDEAPGETLDCMALLMNASAHTQLRASKAAEDPVHAAWLARFTEWTLPRLRSVSLSASCMGLAEVLPLALPPLVEELRLVDYNFGDIDRECNDCMTQMKLNNVRTLTIVDSRFFLPQIRTLLACFPRLERLVGCPPSVWEFDSSRPVMMLEALGPAAGTLKELDMSANACPYEENPEYRVPFGPLCDFPVLEKLNISADRQIWYWQEWQDLEVPWEETLLGQFPASLKELTVTGQDQMVILQMLLPLLHLLGTQELPALRQLAVVFFDGFSDRLAPVPDLRRRCAARGVSLTFPLDERYVEYVHHISDESDESDGCPL